MSVDWNSLPPQMQVEDSSAHDFRIALAGQSFYGIVNVNSGVIYLVAGGPVIRSRSWFGSPMVPDFIRDPIRATFSRGGQAGHAYVINRCGLRHVGSHLHYAGFSVI